MEFKQESFKDFENNGPGMRYRIDYTTDENLSIPEMLNMFDKEKIKQIKYVDCNDYRMIDDGYYDNLDEFLNNYENIKNNTNSEVLFIIRTSTNDKPTDVILYEGTSDFRVKTDDPFFNPDDLFVEKENEHTK